MFSYRIHQSGGWECVEFSGGHILNTNEIRAGKAGLFVRAPSLPFPLFIIIIIFFFSNFFKVKNLEGKKR